MKTVDNVSISDEEDTEYRRQIQEIEKRAGDQLFILAVLIVCLILAGIGYLYGQFK